MFRRQWVLRFGVVLPVLFVVGVVGTAWSAQSAYPSKRIELVVALAAGGGVDAMGRLMAKYLSAELGVPVNVVNKPGGNQVPGVMEALSAPPDGYTLLTEHASSGSLHGLLKNLPYKLEERSFGPTLIEGPSVFYVNGKSPWNSLKDVVEAAKKNPAAFTWGYLGGAAVSDLSLIQILHAGGVDIAKTKPVPHTGGGTISASVAGGHIAFHATGVSAVLGLHKSGDLKVLAVVGDKRLAVLPDVPSTKEAGFPTVTVSSWYGISGPNKLPKNVMDRLDAAAKKIAADTAFRRDTVAKGVEVRYSSPDQTRERILKEVEEFRALVSILPAFK